MKTALFEVLGMKANINMVAAKAGDVTAVAGMGADVTAVAGMGASIVTLAGKGDDISTVAGMDVGAVVAAAAWAHQWAVAAENVTVNDGVNGAGYSAYHWAQKAQASAAAATAIASFNPDDYLQKSGGTVTGDLSISGTFTAPNIYTKTQADEKFLTQDNAQFLPISGGTITGNLSISGDLKTNSELHVGTAGFYSNGDIWGTIWQQWGSGWAFAAIDARIETRAAEWADYKINARCVVDARLAGSTTSSLPGYVVVSVSSSFNSNGNTVTTTAYKKQLQIYIPAIGWRAVGVVL